MKLPEENNPEDLERCKMEIIQALLAIGPRYMLSQQNLSYSLLFFSTNIKDSTNLLFFDLSVLSKVAVYDFNNTHIATLHLDNCFNCIQSSENSLTLPTGTFGSLENFITKYFEHNKNNLLALDELKKLNECCVKTGLNPIIHAKKIIELMNLEIMPINTKQQYNQTN